MKEEVKMKSYLLYLHVISSNEEDTKGYVTIVIKFQELIVYRSAWLSTFID